MNGRTRAQTILTGITFLSVLAAMGCGNYSPVSPSQETSALPGVENPLFVRLLPTSRIAAGIGEEGAASQIISAVDGGIISNGYYSLYFPPGALDEDTEISIEMPEFPYAVVRLGPHGITFNEPVILSLPLEDIEYEESSISVLWLNDETSLWENIGGYIEDGSIKARLEHFSDYGHSPKL